MEFIELLFIAGVTIFILMTVFYVVSLIKKDAGVIDIAWGLGFILIAVVTMFVNASFVERSYLVLTLVTLWGLRLMVHIYLRNRGKKEDWRYAKWRKDWGEMFWLRSFFQVFMLQGVLMLLIAIPIVFVTSVPVAGIGTLDALGVVIWTIGFFFETVSDYQLAQFKSKSSNRYNVMTEGLWKYSRHPNYFGEVTMWWGIFIIALSLPYGIFTIIGPLTITYFIIFVSGVPMLEKKYARRKAFQQYKQTTSVFIPWFPKKQMVEKVN